jgi:hypothetical protein
MPNLDAVISLLQAVERWLEQESEQAELEAIASYQTINQVLEADLD